MKKHQIPIIGCHVDIGTEWIWQLILEAQFCKTTHTDSKQQLINKGPCNASDNTDLWGKLTHCCYTVPFFHCACWTLNHVLSFVKSWLQAVFNAKPGNLHSKPIDTMVRYKPVAVVYIHMVCYLAHFQILSFLVCDCTIDNNVFNLFVHVCAKHWLCVVRVTALCPGYLSSFVKGFSGFEYVWPALIKSANI